MSRHLSSAARLAACLAPSLLALPAWAGDAEAPPEPVVVRVADGASLGQAEKQLGEAARAAGMPEAALVWGDIGSPPKGARPARLEWGDGGRLEGWLMPAADAAGLAKQPPVRQVGVVRYRDGRLHVSHPSGPGGRPLPPRPTPEDRKERGGTFGLFEATDEAAKALAGAVLPLLKDSTQFFRFVLWDVAAGAPAKE